MSLRGVSVVLAVWTMACGSSNDEAPPDATPPAPRPDADLSPPPLPPGVMEWSGTDLTLPTSDLDPLWALVGDARVIGLGESIHTSGGFYATKNRLIRDLIDNHGVRVLAMENPRAGSKVIDTYLQSGACDQPANVILQNSIFYVFASDSTWSLLQWICQRNQANPDDRVRTYGFDIQQPVEDVQEISSFLETYAPIDAPGLESGTAGCSHLYIGADGNLEVPSDYPGCLQGLTALAAYLDTNHDALVAAATEPTFRSARLAVDSWHAFQDESEGFANNDDDGANQARDVEMGAIFEEQLAYEYPAGARVVVWAHNYHLSAKHTEIGGTDSPHTITFGTVVKSDLGADYAPVALVAFNPQINWPSSGGMEYSGYETEIGSVEQRLHQLRRPFLLLDPTAAWQPIVGDILMNDDPMIVRDQYSAVLYLDVSPPMVSVFDGTGTYW